jgi:hypothetical protein
LVLLPKRHCPISRKSWDNHTESFGELKIITDIENALDRNETLYANDMQFKKKELFMNKGIRNLDS